MSYSSRYALVFFFILAGIVGAEPAAKIVQIKGEVKIRRAMEETWQPAGVGGRLEDMDSILTGEAAEVILQTQEGGQFRLGGRAILDMTDLRKLTEREMFLMVMGQKLERLPTRSEKTRLQLGNISSVHGEAKGDTVTVTIDADKWRIEFNGAKALLEQRYYTNTVVKCYKILNRYPHLPDCGEVLFTLGHSYAALGQNGQALEAFQACADKITAQSCDTEESRKRLGLAEDAIAELKR